MEAAIFDDLTVLGDAVRSRMLVLLERHELTVGELCAVCSCRSRRSAGI